MKALIFLSLAFNLASTGWSEEPVPQVTKLETTTTPHGYDQSNFCGNGAKQRLENLNQKTIAEMDKIKNAQNDLNELLAKRNLVKSFLDLRNDYMTSVQKIKDKYSAKEMENVDNFKRLLKSALTFEALKTTTEVNSGQFNNVADLCAGLDKEKKKNPFCNYMTGNTVRFFFSQEIDGINMTLKQYNVAKDKLRPEDKASINEHFKAIYASIPQGINPSATLDTLMEKAPDLVSAVGSPRKKIEECFNDNKASCADLMTTDKDKVQKILKEQLDSVHSAYASGEFERLTKEREGLPDLKKNELHEMTQNKLSQAFQMLKEQNETLNGIGIDDETVQKYAETCSADDKDSRTECEQRTNELIDIFEKQTTKLNEAIQKKSSELDGLTSTSSTLAKTEKMKQYVAQKYVRKCSNTSNDDIKSSLNKCLFVNQDSNPTGNAEVAALNQKLSGVISRMVSDNRISRQQGELGLFSKDELEVYTSYCQNTDMKDFSDICRDVANESDAIKGKRELKDWEKFNQDYWIVPNDKNERGYDVYEKKSNARIFGEGLSMSVGQIYPMWLTNFTLGYQIENLQAQALYMKQMNYMYDPTSPWMANSYFQGSYYSFPNTTNFMMGTTTGTGFNFSN